MLKPGPRPLTRKLLTMLSRARHVESQSLPFNGSDITEKADSIERDSKLTLDRYGHLWPAQDDRARHIDVAARN